MTARQSALPIVAALLGLGSATLPSPALAYDIDCKVILCLAGGFPPGCRDAYRYMIDRITDFPPKPPFGFCAMSNGARYEGTAVDFAGLSGRTSYICPPGKRLEYRREYNDRGPEREYGFCYTNVRTIQTGYGRDRQFETVWEGRSAAQRATYRLSVTVEPGTPSEYRSPTYFIHPRVGIVAQRAR